jgi:YYY domain-containing protein
MIEILHWWIVIAFIGLISLPLARRFFQSYPDRGYILSKALGMCLVCFLNWILCSLHILPFGLVSCLVAIGILAGASWLLKTESPGEIVRFFREEKRTVLITELVFLCAFAFFGFIRMCNPDIASTEKMPDFAFLTGILNSHYFPPKDPWFLGETINYFYYGHYQIAFLTKLTGIVPEFTFNLGIAFLFAMTLTAAFGITYGLTKRLKYGFLGGLFVALIGNLDGINQLLSKVVFGSDKFYPFSWFNWWMSSRVIVREGIDVTINEFPFWSYVLGDLHAHVNVVPFSLLVLAVALELIRSNGDGLSVLGKGKEMYFRLAVAAVALGAIPAANTWDTPTYYGIMVMTLIFARQFTRKPAVSSYGGFLVNPVRELISRRSEPVEESSSHSPFKWKSWAMTLVAVVLLVALSGLLYAPFHIHFNPKGTQGVHWVNPIQRTLWDDFLTIYGFFFFCLMSMVIFLVKDRLQKIPMRLMPLVVASFIAGFLIFFMLFQTFMIALCLFCLILLLMIPFSMDNENRIETFFALSLFVLVLLILLGCEFLYIKDAYGKSLERQNTIFKFYYQAWIFCGISSAYAVFWIREKARGSWKFSWDIIFRVLLVATFAFPVFGTTIKCNHFSALRSNSPYSKATLNGIYYMSWRYKGDYKAIHYLKKYASPDDVVLEATGPAFSHYGRISAGTGMYTLVGWANHENIWRDGSWSMVSERTNDTKTIYTTQNIEQARGLLDRYGIDYVFYGILEREQYPSAVIDKFNTFMTPVFEIVDSDNKTSYLYSYNPRSASSEE